ncbi:helix-turn-helix transcriptional regulator [Actinomadura rudentiformis]|uniref:AAA family ATPase n=1 Tax=Actinomadura rudentiformis TaxID=359158 RepID=A0A6H9YMA3_9ACTN|nr:helix-turn-helix transcriptional regulator [Actinomadura rudentiformis]KAB2346930.1 AAA family ATPase [Actinomadura rudentiformis]
MLYGREKEQEAIARLLDDARAGRAGVLFLRGEAGIGKSALLEYAAVTAQMRLLRVSGVESEASLPFAALHLLLRPVIDRVRAMPARQAEALTAAFGMADDAAPAERYLIGIATLNLLIELSADGPVLCLVDDAQWLDRESADTLAFVARRLHAEPVVMVLAARDEPIPFPAADVPELRLGGLSRAMADRLLAESTAELPLAVREQIAVEAQGNPLALLELPRILTPEQRAGASSPSAFSLGGGEPVSGQVLAGFRARIAALPDAARTCVLVAALEDTGELVTLTRVLRELGSALDDFAPAERAGLVTVTEGGVRFRHPLVRTAARLSADVAQRMTAHRALARAVDDDRRAWHLAAVTLEPDEEVAAGLEAVAVRARQRGGQATMAAAYARAAELSADPQARRRRLAAGAVAAAAAGLWQRADDLAHRAGLLGPARDPGVAAELARTRSILAFRSGRPLEAARLLQEGVAAIVETDPVTALSMLGQASLYVWGSSTHPDQVPLARRTEELTPRLDGPLDAVRTFNQGMRQLIEGDITMAASAATGLSREESLPFETRLLAATVGLISGDLEGMIELAARLVTECREAGRMGHLAQAMTLLAVAQLLDGRHRAAQASVGEGLRIAEDLGSPYWQDYLTGLAAWLAGVAGEEERCRDLAKRASARQEVWTLGFAWATYTLIVLDLGAGRHESVLRRLDDAVTGPARHAHLWSLASADYVEAAVRLGTPERAGWALARIRALSEAVRQPWVDALLHRCEALLAGSGEGFERALERHRHSGKDFDRARTQLLYGEWLRRHQRRGEARRHLEAALETFDRLGATPWADRAAAELRASGVPVSRHADVLGTLTPQELQVVRLAATGASNREIGAHLFLSPRTVAYHLYKAFPKLGVSSRAELAGRVLT